MIFYYKESCYYNTLRAGPGLRCPSPVRYSYYGTNQVGYSRRINQFIMSCGRGNKSLLITEDRKPVEESFLQNEGEDSGIGQSAKRSGLTAKMHKAT